jgi:hypothetical protein
MFHWLKLQEVKPGFVSLIVQTQEFYTEVPENYFQPKMLQII